MLMKETRLWTHIRVYRYWIMVYTWNFIMLGANVASMNLIKNNKLWKKVYINSITLADGDILLLAKAGVYLSYGGHVSQKITLLVVQFRS